MGSKKEIREEIKRLKRSTFPNELAAKSASIVKSIEEFEAFRSAKTVLMFSPLSDEPDLTPLLSAYLGKKKIILPVVEGENLALRQLLDIENMRVGAFGISEPMESEFRDYEAIDLALIPGVAFDKAGNRMGRGRGYYDKLLCDSRFSKVEKLGIAFGFQIVEAVPCEAHDVKMDGVVSEEAVYI